MKDTKGWRSEYKRLWRLSKNPVWQKDFPNDDPLIPSEKKANGLTKIIVKFLTWKGHYANRINVQGQARIHKIPRYNLHSGKIETTDQVRYTKSTTKRGTPDINCIINGKAVTIEVKVGKDKMSDVQIEQQGNIEAAGGIYFLARDMTTFYNWYYETFDHGNNLG